MQRIERLHAITEELRRHAPSVVSAQQLARQFDVSKRTIERDLETLRLSGVPLFGHTGRRGGSGLIQAGPTRPVSFSVAELASIVVAAHVADGAPYASAARSAIAKLLGAADPSTRVALEQLRERFRIAIPDDAARPRVRSVVEDAVRTQTVVRLRSRDRDGRVTRRRVDPVGFSLDRDHWALIGWCHLRQAGRMFVVSRIERADLTGAAAALHDVDEVLGWVPRPGRAPIDVGKARPVVEP